MAHPVIFFEVLAKDQELLRTFYSKVFGWEYEMGDDLHGHRFAYVTPPFDDVQVRGGIGFAPPSAGGRVNFYVEVDDLPGTLEIVNSNGGRTAMAPVSVDGYSFATFQDPELNTVGIVLPFPAA